MARRSGWNVCGRRWILGLKASGLKAAFCGARNRDQGLLVPMKTLTVVTDAHHQIGLVHLEDAGAGQVVVASTEELLWTQAIC